MYSLKCKWCVKFLGSLKQSLSSQARNPSALTQWSPVPFNSNEELNLTYSPAPYLHALCHWHGEEQRTHPEKHLNQVLSSIQINVAQESPPLGGEVEPADLLGVHSGSILLRALPHAEAALGPTDLGLRRERSTGMGVRRSHQPTGWGARAKQVREVVTGQGWEIFYAKPKLPT